MPRPRYDTVPESDTEIIEEVTYRQKTKRGMTLKQTRVPMEQSAKSKTGTASTSRSKTKKHVQTTQAEDATVGDHMLQAYDFVGDDDIQPEHASERIEPQVTVWFYDLLFTWF